MGAFGVFRCVTCAYTAQAVGGLDRGEVVELRTVSCLDCRALHDVVVRRWDEGRLEPPRRRARIRCPEDPAHRVVRWSPRRGCPRCGGPVTVVERGLWD